MDGDFLSSYCVGLHFYLDLDLEYYEYSYVLLM